jgi:hypothetical protein
MPYTKLYQAFVSYLDAAQAHLGYWDILYFSMSAATTATTRRHSIQLFIGAHAGVSAGVEEHRI